MDLEKRIDLYRTEYLFQIDMKEKIYTRMAIFSVFITGCITANFTMLDSLLKLPQTQLAIVVGFWIWSLWILISIIMNIYAISGSKYDKLVNSNGEMEQHRVALKKHFINNTVTPSNDPSYTQEIEEYVNKQFKLYLVELYAECSSAYFLNNVDRQTKLTKIAGYSYLILVFTLIVSMFFIFQKLEGKFDEPKPKHSTTTTTTTHKSNQG